MKIARILVAAAVGAVVTLGVAAAPARAACYGAGCDGRDAVAQECSGDARTISSRYTRPGVEGPMAATVELRYSSDCWAVWARFTGESYSSFHATWRVTIREYDLDRNFIRQHTSDFAAADVYHVRTQMMGYSSYRWFRACWRPLMPSSGLHCSDFV